MDDLVGTTLGHYRLVEKIGAGGMGVVYRARDERLDRDVAVKVLPDEVASDRVRLSRFDREAKATARLDHPNILAIHDYGADHGLPYVVMELLEGHTLRDEIVTGRVSPAKAVVYGRDIADGLAAAHDRGIIHRDLKPENVFLTRDGLVKILDFGLAKLTAPDQGPAQSIDTTQLETAPGRPVGTVAYMAPEQVEGDHVDHRSDLFALGAILYELLTGHRPFRGKTVASTAAAILRDDPEPISTRAPTTSPALERIVAKCLEKRPDDRFDSARDLSFALQAVEPVAHRRRRVIRAKSRARWPLAVAAAAAIVATGVAAGLFLGRTPAVPFHERDWLLITDFENHTGDPVFDHALDAAFAIAVEQSNRINVISRQSVQPILRQMRRADADHIDEVLGRDIARRRGVDFILVPTISQLADSFVLTAAIRDVETGATYGSRTVHADAFDTVLPALDRLSRRIRRDLGEALTSVLRHSRPLPEATTASLVALEQFGLARQHHVRVEFAEAARRYEEALRLDPGFTSAKAGLARVHLDNEGLFPSADQELGTRLLSEAASEAGSLTTPERLLVLESHARFVANDPEKAVEELEQLVSMYPDHPTALNNLGRLCFLMDKPEEARSYYERAIEADPNQVISYNGLVWLLLRDVGDVPAVIVWATRELEVDPEQRWPHLNLSWAYLATGDTARALVHAQRAAEIAPGDPTSHYRVGHALRASGRYTDAAAAFDRVLEVTPRDFWAHYQAGVVLRQAGDEAEARRRFEAFKQAAEQVVTENPNYRAWQLVLDHVLVRLGEPTRTEITSEDLASGDPELNFALARLFSLQGRHDDAIGHLERTLEGGFKDPIWVLIHPDLDALRDDSRYVVLKRRALHLDEGRGGQTEES